MIYCALILTASLPASCIVVGVLLIVITIAALLMCALKWREAAVLKKEVEELRDTMRMMRYEEANLSRMLHTVSKQPTAMPEEVATEETYPIIEEELIEEAAKETTEETIEEVAEEATEGIVAVKEEKEEEVVSEENVVGESIEEENVSKKEITINEDTTEEVLIEETPEEEVIEEETLEESVAEPEIEESIIEEPIIEEPVEEPVAEEEVINEVAIATIVEEYIDPKPRKQAINERRPAIPPTDLFAAWFEENDTIEPEEPETPAITHKPVLTEPL